jgi:amino acid adenylation domain-containing protein
MPFLLWHQFKETAERYPSLPAVICSGKTMLYQDLDEQSTRLANFLMNRGIGSGCRVGFYLQKSLESVIAMLGVLKAGAAYVPLDPAAPPKRAAFMISNCAVSGLITTSRRLDLLKNELQENRTLQTILLTGEPDRSFSSFGSAATHSWGILSQFAGSRIIAAPATEADPAYLLYTSGSTGTPKGVILTHRNALTFVDWGTETFKVCAEDRLSNHAPLHFDLSVFDIFVAFKTGACVVMVPDEIAPFPMELARWIDVERISIWYSVPSALVRLLLHGRLEQFSYSSLRTVLFAGEVFPIKYLRELTNKLQHVDFYNLYGPTETNVCTFYKVPTLSCTQTEEIPIGVACANTEVLVLDGQGHPVTPGEVGELLVRGPSVMLGYWGLAEKTAQVLLANPLQRAYQERVYRTGDYVRVREDGNYIFCGRKDNMIKSRGHRIELGEIEHVLGQHPHIREVVVLALPDADIGARLKSVVVLDQNGSISQAELRGFCLARLPRYMVPEEFIFTDNLPRTSTGKADRVALHTQFHKGGKSI